MSDDADPREDSERGEPLGISSGFVGGGSLPAPRTRADLLAACVGYGMDTRVAIQLCSDFPPFGYFADEEGPELGQHRPTFADGTGWASPPPRLLGPTGSEPPAATASAVPVGGFRPNAVTRIPLDQVDEVRTASAPTATAPPPPPEVRAFAAEVSFSYGLLNISHGDHLEDDEFVTASLLYVTGMSTLRITTGQQHGLAHLMVEVADRDPGLDPSDWEMVDVARLPPLPGDPRRYLGGGFDPETVLVWDEPGAVMVRVGSHVRDPDVIEPVGPDGDIELPPEEYVIQLWPAVAREGERAGTASPTTS